MVDVLVAAQVVVLIAQDHIMLIAVNLLEVITIAPGIVVMIQDIVDAPPGVLAVPVQDVVVAVVVEVINVTLAPTIKVLNFNNISFAFS
jgi:hypothetical protein